jgi:hypothetical protein
MESTKAESKKVNYLLLCKQTPIPLLKSAWVPLVMLPPVWQQVGEPAVIVGFVEFSQNGEQPVMWIYPVLFAGCEQGVDHCGVLGGGVGTCEQVVFPSDVM